MLAFSIRSSAVEPDKKKKNMSHLMTWSLLLFHYEKFIESLYLYYKLLDCVTIFSHWDHTNKTKKKTKKESCNKPKLFRFF